MSTSDAEKAQVARKKMMVEAASMKLTFARRLHDLPNLSPALVERVSTAHNQAEAAAVSATRAIAKRDEILSTVFQCLYVQRLDINTTAQMLGISRWSLNRSRNQLFELIADDKQIDKAIQQWWQELSKVDSVHISAPSSSETTKEES